MASGVTMTTLKLLVLLWIWSCVLLQGMSQLVTPTKGFQDARSGVLTTPSPTEDKSAALTVAALGVIIFIAILVVIVIILVSVVSLRFRCRHCKDVEDKQKPQHPMVSYSCSDADATASKKNVLLVSMKDLNTSNSVGKTMVAYEE